MYSTARQRAGIRENQYGRSAAFLELVSEPVATLRWRTQSRLNRSLQQWLPGLLHRDRTGGLQLRHALLTLGPRRRLIEILLFPAQRFGKDRQIDVFRETRDGVEHFRERSAAFEDAGVRKLGLGKNATKILFDNHRVDATALLVLTEE